MLDDQPVAGSPLTEASFDEHHQPPKVSFVTFWLIGINVLVYLAMCLSGASPFNPTSQDALRWGASFAPITLDGQWWRILTACFVHFGIIHIGMNMFILYQIGLLTEILFGRVRFLILYLLSGLFGGVVSLYLHPMGTSAGASGAIFGLFGGLLAFLLVQRDIIPKSEAVRIAKSAGIFIAYNIVFGLADKRVDLSAHGGGLVAGFIIGLMLATQDRTAQRRAFDLRTVTVVVCSLMLLVASCRVLARTDPNHSDWYRDVMLGASVPLGNSGKLVYVGVTSAEAQKLAQGILAEGLARNPGTVMLFSRTAAGPRLSIPIGRDESTYKPLQLKTSKLVDGKSVVSSTSEPAEPLPWTDPRVVGSFTATGIALAPFIGGPPLTIQLLNTHGDVRRTIVIDEHQLTVGKEDVIWYTGSVTAKEAQALGAALQAVGLFHDQGAHVMLSRTSAGTALSFLVPDEHAGDPRLLAALSVVARTVAPSIGGLPLTVHVTDPTLQPLKSFVVQPR